MARIKHLNTLNSATEQLLALLQQRIARSTRSSRAGKVTYIIGNNGTGKSRVLGALAERLSTTRPLRTVACIASSIHDRFTFGSSGQVRYLGVRNATNAVFLSAMARQLSRLILQAMAIDRERFNALREAVNMDLVFRLGNNVESNVKKILEGSDREKVNSKAVHFKHLVTSRYASIIRRIASGSGQFERLTDLQIQTLLQYLELGIEIDLYVALDDGLLLNFVELSTGEQNRILVLAKVLSSMEEGAVFLIDEPEVSLHLHWQMSFHETLMKLLSKLARFHVVIATHAPVVISEAAKYDPLNKENLVAILRHEVGEDENPIAIKFGKGNVILETHSFADVASHDQLVLRYFQTSPYEARAISAEIADTVLSVAEGTKELSEAATILKRLKATQGLSEEALQQINQAISLIDRDLVCSIKGIE